MNKVTKGDFYRLTSCLSRRISQEDAISLFTQEEDYLPVIKLANQYWLLAHLCQSIQQLGVWNHLDEPIKHYFTEIYDAYKNRATHIVEELDCLSAVISHSDIPCVLLKGSAALLNGSTKPSSIRYMADIDILVPEDRIPELVHLLTVHGYQQDDPAFDIHKNLSHHISPLKRNNSFCYIEAHRWPLAHRAKMHLTAENIFKNMLSIDGCDLIFKQMSPSHQIIVEVAHAEFSDGAFEAKYLNLQKLVNLYTMISYWNANDKNTIDWAEVSAHFERPEQMTALQAKLIALYEFFGLMTPITDVTNEQALLHLELCIRRYEKHQADKNFWFDLKKRFASYQKDIIYARYGGSGYLGWLTGVCKQIRVHAQKAIAMLTEKGK